MKKSLKFASLLLSLSLLASSAFSLKVKAENENIITTEDGYTFNMDTGVIIEYNGDEAFIEIPTTINGVKVTKIGQIAFPNPEKIQTISVPDGIDLDKGAFAYCGYTARIKLPYGVKKLNATFVNCYLLHDLVIPDSVEIIDPVSFSSCVDLDKLTMPSNVSLIHDKVEYPNETQNFERCINLNSLYFTGTTTKSHMKELITALKDNKLNMDQIENFAIAVSDEKVFNNDYDYNIDVMKALDLQNLTGNKAYYLNPTEIDISNLNINDESVLGAVNYGIYSKSIDFATGELLDDEAKVDSSLVTNSLDIIAPLNSEDLEGIDLNSVDLSFMKLIPMSENGALDYDNAIIPAIENNALKITVNPNLNYAVAIDFNINRDDTNPISTDNTSNTAVNENVAGSTTKTSDNNVLPIALCVSLISLSTIVLVANKKRRVHN